MIPITNGSRSAGSANWSRSRGPRSIDNAFDTGSEARAGIGSWIDYYNRRRTHSTFGGKTPDEVYATAEMTEKLAA